MANNKLVKSARKPPAAGMGRKKGVPNRVTKLVRDMITQALDDAGGVSYLVERAHDPKTASAFLTLVGKVLPVQLTGDGGGPVQVTRIELVAMSGDDEEN